MGVHRLEVDRRPTQQSKTPGKAKRINITRMFPFIREVNEEYGTLTRDILEDKNLSSREGEVTSLRKHQEAFRTRLTDNTDLGRN